jgi:hypothetical protein
MLAKSTFKLYIYRKEEELIALLLVEVNDLLLLMTEQDKRTQTNKNKIHQKK